MPFLHLPKHFLPFTQPSKKQFSFLILLLSLYITSIRHATEKHTLFPRKIPETKKKNYQHIAFIYLSI